MNERLKNLRLIPEVNFRRAGGTRGPVGPEEPGDQGGQGGQGGQGTRWQNF